MKKIFQAHEQLKGEKTEKLQATHTGKGCWGVNRRWGWSREEIAEKRSDHEIRTWTRSEEGN